MRGEDIRRQLAWDEWNIEWTSKNERTATLMMSDTMSYNVKRKEKNLEWLELLIA